MKIHAKSIFVIVSCLAVMAPTLSVFGAESDGANSQFKTSKVADFHRVDPSDLGAAPWALNHQIKLIPRVIKVLILVTKTLGNLKVKELCQQIIPIMQANYKV